jgi:predicted HNH restriction endonuclease
MRNPWVRGAFRCEVPNCAHLPFEGRDGRPYSEVHHIEPLAEGGADTPANVASVCPAHHREAHHGQQAGEIRAALAGLRRQDT